MRPCPTSRGKGAIHVGNGGEIRLPTTLYLIMLTYTQPLDVVNTHLEEHRAYLRRNYAAGHFIVSGPRVPSGGGVILARAASDQDARALTRDDPFSQLGLATYEIIAFDALWSAPEFAAVLAQPHTQPDTDES